MNNMQKSIDMLNDKKLFEMMIKYHSTIIGLLVNKKIITKEDDKFMLNDNNCDDEILNGLMSISFSNNFPSNELIALFTVENIQQNIDKWSEPQENKFLTMQRTPDVNYHFYQVITQWDIFSKAKDIPLTYELAKYLSGIEIKTGGLYIESDGGTIEVDQRFPVDNGLKIFSHHNFVDLENVIKCVDDEKTCDILIKNHNSDVIKSLLNMFFKDYSMGNYIEVINRQKDWDETDEFKDNEIE